MQATREATSARTAQHRHWHVALKHSKRKQLDKEHPVQALPEKVEQIKASIRAKVKHPFKVLKQQFGYVKVGYWGLKKNTLQIVTLLAMGNLWMARHKLLAMGQVRVLKA